MVASRWDRLPTLALALVVPLVALVTVVVTLNVTSDDTVTALAGAGKAGDSITIKNFQFSPNLLVVSAGTAVTVTNGDSTPHTVTAKDGAFDTGHVDGGASATITVRTPGTYRYFCEIHNYMTGTIEAR